MRILLTGATGFIGKQLRPHLEQNGHTVEIVSRRPGLGRSWDPADIREGVEASDAVIHLAGAGVLDRRWTPAYKTEILDSRVETTRTLATACAEAGRRLVSSSAVGYYPPGPMSAPVDEDAPPGKDFLADVCRQWESALEPTRDTAAPSAVVRNGIVLGTGGGALQSLLIPFRLGLGGPIGDGRQPFPWVHVGDVCRLYTWLATHPEHTGAHNAVSPECCDQATFARTLARILHRPSLLPTPEFLLHGLLGERAEVLTTGQHVVPRRTIASGFTFAHPTLEPALRDILSP